MSQVLVCWIAGLYFVQIFFLLTRPSDSLYSNTVPCHALCIHFILTKMWRNSFFLVPSSEETSFLTTFYDLYFSHHYTHITHYKSCWTFCVGRYSYSNSNNPVTYFHWKILALAGIWTRDLPSTKPAWIRLASLFIHLKTLLLKNQGTQGISVINTIVQISLAGPGTQSTATGCPHQILLKTQIAFRVLNFPTNTTQRTPPPD